MGGYEPPGSGSRRIENLRICRKIRPGSLLRGWLRIPVAVLTKALLSAAFSFLLGPITDQFRESVPATGRSLTRYRTLLEDCLAAVGRSSNGRANRVRERVRRLPRAPGGCIVNYARRQQYRRLSHTGKRAWEASSPRCSDSRPRARERWRSAAAAPRSRWDGAPRSALASLAGRSRVGARSEDEVQRALASLWAEGWRLRHSLPWQAG
jgi:hypothetical protein